jgi:hypothetical protein
MAYPAQDQGRAVFNTAINESRRIYGYYFWDVKGVPDHERLGQCLYQLYEALTHFGEKSGISQVTNAEDTVELSFAQLMGGLLSLLADLEMGLCQAASGRGTVTRAGHSVQVTYDTPWVQDVVCGLCYYTQSVEILMESIQR